MRLPGLSIESLSQWRRLHKDRNQRSGRERREGGEVEVQVPYWLHGAHLRDIRVRGQPVPVRWNLRTISGQRIPLPVSTRQTWPLLRAQ